MEEYVIRERWEWHPESIYSWAYQKGGSERVEGSTHTLVIGSPNNHRITRDVVTRGMNCIPGFCFCFLFSFFLFPLASVQLIPLQWLERMDCKFLSAHTWGVEVDLVERAYR